MLKIYSPVLQSHRGKRICREVIRRKFTKADVIKKLMREQKQCFGALLETKKEKIKRLKRENKGIISATPPSPPPNNVDSELAWVLRNSSNRLRVLKFNSESRSNIVSVPNQIVSQTNLGRVAPDIDDEILPPCPVKIIASETVKTTAPKVVKITAPKAVKITAPKAVKITAPKAVKITPLKAVKITPPKAVKITAPKAVKITAPKAVKITAPIATSSIASMEEEEFSKLLTKENSDKAAPRTVDKTVDKETIVQAVAQTTVPDNNAPKVQLGTFLDKLLYQCKNRFRAKNNPETIELKAESEDVAKPHTPDLQIKKISQAPLFTEKGQDCTKVWDSTILSISAMENKQSLHLPSVTKILNATMSASARKLLDMWMARMIRDLGQEGFDAYKRDLLANGKLFHSLIVNALRKMPVDVPATLRPSFDSVKTVLNEIEDVRAIESHVVHHNLGYRGVLDCVASYKGNLCLIDWKKSDKPKDLLSSTYDAPLQIASYIGALNADENYPFQIKNGIIVIAYTIGHHPTVYQLDEKKLQLYWKQWLNRLKNYYQMQSS